VKKRRGRPRKDNVAEGSNTDKSRIRRAGLAVKRAQAERNTRRMEKILLWEIDREGKVATIPVYQHADDGSRSRRGGLRPGLVSRASKNSAVVKVARILSDPSQTQT
jgi:hypothetical protein